MKSVVKSMLKLQYTNSWSSTEEIRTGMEGGMDRGRDGWRDGGMEGWRDGGMEEGGGRREGG